mmetsp:Transcript_30047/g.49644  ORF Transcript_30047/g.49644 Transcript_30047/m.49644 type:complete len:297 (-) Transcript_30047:10-900(-)
MMSSILLARKIRPSRAPAALSLTQSFSTYAEEKQAQKELRRTQWTERQQRMEGLQTRRNGRDRDTKKAEFKAWYDKRRTYHQIMDRKARQEGLEWKIAVAAVVERLPVVTPDMKEWEREYSELRAYLDTFGFEYPEELGMDKMDEKYGDDEEVVPLPRETEADASGDLQTMDRRLKTRIYYAQKNDEGSLWAFPTAVLVGEETLKEAAQRVAKETLGDDIEILALSNCPVAVDLDVDKKDGFYGTKTFFMKLQYFQGKPNQVEQVADYGWLDRSELAERAEAGEGPNAAKFVRYLL